MSRRHATALCAGAIALVLTGCGGSSTGTSPTPGSSASSTTSPDTPLGTPLGTEAVPASGPQVVVDGLTLHLPEDYTVTDLTDDSTQARRLDDDGLNTFGAFTLPTLGLDESLQEMMQRQIDLNLLFQSDPVPVASVLIDGRKWYRATGDINSEIFAEIYGSASDSHEASLTFFFLQDMPTAQREEIIDSVLATVTLD